jgi:hypothetical protein
MRRILGLAVFLGLLASAMTSKANEGSPEATLTRIEKDFAETQITKDTKAVAPAMLQPRTRKNSDVAALGHGPRNISRRAKARCQVLAILYSF